MDVRNIRTGHTLATSRCIGQPQAEQYAKHGCVLQIYFAQLLVWLQNVDMDGGSDGKARGQSSYLSPPHCWREANRPPQA
eukprot:355093-Chlamydomonas_euryale.AAC.11